MIVPDHSPHTRTCPESVTWRLGETVGIMIPPNVSAGSNSVEITVPSLDSVISSLIS
ncbi:hypothetical protein DPMN_112449 [Dreissena polymorpha]|uniref:Uncharacterized protein n=1 Tax=Dreissena polymorpha TaxID=45954 RepID=A0A9D4KGD6_DREPO|nr:hypothetical protein DPMN_112449 [Dreissena polymorpha]